MDKNLYIVHCWDDYGDGESGPMPYDWFMPIVAESIGDAWLKGKECGCVCVGEQDEDGKWLPDIRLANNRELGEYRAYKREVKLFKQKYGTDEEDCPFGIHDFFTAEEELR